MLPALRHVESWIFDLDNTLYPASADLFRLIDVRMGRYIEQLIGCDPAEARRIQKDYFREHGTTLSGLMTSHAVDPHDFLNFVHDIEMDVLAEDRRLVEAVARLPGRKLIFTNGDAPYARRVLARLGLSESFEAIHDIHELCGDVRGARGRTRNRAVRRGHGPQPRARQGARHDDRLGEQRLGTWRPWRASGFHRF
jgi:putative hydrolase of the HAD superfamily